MENWKDGAGGLPQNVLSCGAGKTGQTLPNGCGTDPELLAHIESARSKGKGPASNDDVARIWQFIEKAAKRLAGNSAKAKSTFDPLKSMSTKEVNSAEGLTYLFELMVATIFNEDHLRWTGCDNQGQALSFEQHFTNMAKYELNQLRFDQSHSGRYSRRTWNRWWKVVSECSEHGQVDQKAIDLARTKVDNGDFKNTENAISVTKFDQCAEDYWGHADLSLDIEFVQDDGERETAGDLLEDRVFSRPFTSAEQDVAEKAYLALGPRTQEMFNRANGLTGDVELLADIARDFNLTEQRVGQIVNGARKVLAAAVEDYRFHNGQPPFEQ